MASQALSEGHDKQNVEDSLVNICSGKVSEAAADLSHQVEQRWPQYGATEDIRTKMLCKFRETVKFWMADLSQPRNQESTSNNRKLQPLTKRGMSQPKLKTTQRKKR